MLSSLTLTTNLNRNRIFWGVSRRLTQTTFDYFDKRGLSLLFCSFLCVHQLVGIICSKKRVTDWNEIQLNEAYEEEQLLDQNHEQKDTQRHEGVPHSELPQCVPPPPFIGRFHLLNAPSCHNSIHYAPHISDPPPHTTCDLVSKDLTQEWDHITMHWIFENPTEDQISAFSFAISAIAKHARGQLP